MILALCSVNYLLLETPGTGAYEGLYRFDPVRLFRYHSSGAFFLICAEFIFIAYILVFLCIEVYPDFCPYKQPLTAARFLAA